MTTVAVSLIIDGTTGVAAFAAVIAVLAAPPSAVHDAA